MNIFFLFFLNLASGQVHFYRWKTLRQIRQSVFFVPIRRSIWLTGLIMWSDWINFQELSKESGWQNIYIVWILIASLATKFVIFLANCCSNITQLNTVLYRSQCRNVLNTILSNILRPVFALICFHLLAQKPNLEKFSIYSNQFFHNFHLAESSFTCPKLRASWLARTQQDSLSGMFIVLSFTYSSSDWHKNKHFVMNFWVNTPPSLVSLGLVL